MMCCKLKLLRPDVLMQFSKKQDQNTVKQLIYQIYIFLNKFLAVGVLRTDNCILR